MLESDLKQIKQIVDTSVKQIVDKSLDEKLDKKFKENNKKIFERMDTMEERIMISTQKEFHDINEKLDGINGTLKKKVNRDTLLDWADKRILNLESDRNKAKYLHIKEWKNLPSASKINNALIKEGIK